MSDGADDLARLAAAIDWTDADAAMRARSADLAGIGRLADLVEWLAACQGAFPPHRPERARCVSLGEPPDTTRTIAADVGAGVRVLVPEQGVEAALGAGTAVADEEIEAGADLIVVTGGSTGAPDAAAVLVALLSGAEPVAMLPRGADAVDTVLWIERAERLRDTRRQVSGYRSKPARLLEVLDDSALTAATGLILRAVGRRTPVLLDGTTALAAALLCHDVQARAGRWWRIADSSPDPVHARVVEELGHPPLLGLDTARGDGAAGLLCLPLLGVATVFAGRQ